MKTLQYILDKYQVKGKGLIKLHCTRWGTFPILFKELGFTLGAEIGVYKGRFSKQLLRLNPNLKLYGIDAWQVYDGYEDTQDPEHMERIYKEARMRLAPYNFKIIIDWSMKAVKRFKDESLDFVYIDGNHSYESVKEDIREWSKKVKKGGIVAGHDYINGHRGITFGVRQALDEWIKKNKIPYLFILNKDVNKDQMPSWFYVKV